MKGPHVYTAVRFFVVATAVLALGLATVGTPRLHAAGWTPTGAMNTPRRGHTMTLLPDGRVLVAGGVDASGTPLSSAEVWDPATGRWTPTASMHEARASHRAVLLKTGLVLVAGPQSAELYDAVTGTWTMTGAMVASHSYVPLTLLPNGKVLVVGGHTAELYDPTAGVWSVVDGPSGEHGDGHTASLLPTGQVLFAGSNVSSVCTRIEMREWGRTWWILQCHSFISAGCDLYDSATGAWRAGGGPSLTQATATTLQDGRVVVVGGRMTVGGEWFGPDDRWVNAWETYIYQPATGSWVSRDGLLRHNHISALLPSGRVLAAGGNDGEWNKSGTVLASSGLFDPVSLTWASAALMKDARELFSGLTLPDGRVLVTGGGNASSPVLASAEIYSVRTVADTDADGRSEILWHQATTGDVSVWRTDGSAVSSRRWVWGVDPGWQAVGQSDFTGDGRADLLWWNAASGETVLWAMDGATRTAVNSIATVDPGYRVAGTGDYDGDGRSDILWRHVSNGETWLWLMNGAAVRSVTQLPWVSAGYEVVGSGDLDGNARSDIVWRHATDGDVWVWLMDGATVKSATYVGAVADSGYRIAGVADFDSDGHADIVWRHQVWGEVWMWQMNGAMLTGAALVGTVPDTGYEIVGTGDYNGDGKADLLWRHASAGDLWAWLMDGSRVSSANAIGVVADTGYRVVNPR